VVAFRRLIGKNSSDGVSFGVYGRIAANSGRGGIITSVAGIA
jgi:hypothetical protein